MSKILSPFPYYGGKARMAPIICSMLDYYNSSAYIEPYGGGGRILLNKKRHEVEIYSDFGYGLSTFMEVMTDREKTEELIESLLIKPPSKEKFDKLVIERMAIEDRLNTSTNAELASLARECSQKYNNHYLFKEIGRAVRGEKYDVIIELIIKIMNCRDFELEAIEWLQFEHFCNLYKDYWELVGYAYIEAYGLAVKGFEAEWSKVISADESSKHIQKLYENGKEQFAREYALDVINAFTDDITNSNEMGTSVRDVDIAFDIFHLYYCSRDGMGLVWSEEKNKNIKSYYKAVRNLRNVSERMRDVVVMQQIDAMDLIREYRKDENVMLYLDPSYLKPEDETKNLGEVYKMSYGYEEHEKLLEEITESDTKAKILISNYDVELYNMYLKDWKKTYYKTYTGVGGKKGNRRVEVLWQNYN